MHICLKCCLAMPRKSWETAFCFMSGKDAAAAGSAELSGKKEDHE